MAIFLSLGTKFLFREIDQEKHFGLEEINEIQVTMSSAPIHIIRTDTGNSVGFHYYGRALQEIELVSEISNKKLMVSAKRKYLLLGTAEDICLDIYIPGEYQRNISIKTSSGAVKMDPLDLLDFTLNTSSGGLEAEKLAAEKITLNTTSGKLNIKNLSANELEIKGSSSSIHIAECNVKEARIKTTSGKVILENSSGNLDVQDTSGDVLVACKRFADQNINIATTSGNVKLELPDSAEFILKAGNTSGNIQSDFQVNAAGSVSPHKIEGQSGAKSNKVTIQAKSGSIQILKSSH